MRLIFLGVFGLLVAPVFAQPESVLPNAPQPPAPVRDVRWDKVEELVPGESVELRERSNGVRTECDVVDVTDTTFVCDVMDRRGPARRMVYPHGSVDRVWVIRVGRGPSPKAILIGAGVGALLGGLAFRTSTAAGVGSGILLGGSLGGGLVAISDPLRLHTFKQRRLIYVAP